MVENRAVAYFEHIGYDQYRLRLQDNDPTNRNQWFIHDSRTNTIRPINKRNHVLANQLGYRFTLNVAVVVRPYVNDLTVGIRWINGHFHNLQNNGGHCLDVAGYSNVYSAHIIFWNCHNGAN